MNNILYAVLKNIFPEHLELTRIAIKAFARAAPYTNRNFRIDEQRAYIMNAVLNAAKIQDEEVLDHLMQAIVDIARVNYDYLEEYI